MLNKSEDKILQNVIEDLLIINNQILYLGHANPPLNWLACQVHCRIINVIGNISKLIEEDASYRFEPKDFSLFNYMTCEELQVLDKIENIRSNLILAWKFVENQKMGLLRIVKERRSQ